MPHRQHGSEADHGKWSQDKEGLATGPTKRKEKCFLKLEKKISFGELAIFVWSEVWHWNESLSVSTWPPPCWAISMTALWARSPAHTQTPLFCFEQEYIIYQVSRSTAPFEECPGTFLLFCTITEMGHHGIGQRERRRCSDEDAPNQGWAVWT